MKRRLAALVVVALLNAPLVPCFARAPVPAAAFGASAIDERSGAPVFTFHGRPFFVYGAAFFYERMPRDSWRAAMYALKYQLHINTLDLYVPWNWHELSDGDFDFDGRTNPRRDLREVLRLARAFGFALIVRPGPVIRNEWRNGGYPAWLLRRPEYGMPLRDRLEGRYPPTATLQNARSDDAAGAWLRNATHLHYARRWLQAALREFVPVAPQVIAIALDDDQGAYIDNQTWPAPHLRAYLEWLRACVASVTQSRVPVFINTYQMKVTASSPVWAMGNWYQSDTYAIGEHDRAQLEFSTGLLQTRLHQPLMASEFQAGWLQQPQDVLPQAAAPSNTALALQTLVAMGARGIVNFPAQDTLYPAGYEVPFANAFYAWDAALAYSGATGIGRPAPENPRAAPLRLLGAEIATFNPLLAAARVDSDAAIVSLPSAYEARRLTNADIATLADGTMAAQRFCRRVRLTCELVDLRYGELARLRAFPLLIVPLPQRGPLRGRRFIPAAAALLAAYRRSRGTAVLAAAQPSLAALAFALQRARHERYVEGADASFAEDPATGAGFLSIVNYERVPRDYERVVIRSRNGRRFALPRVSVSARAALLLPFDVPLAIFDARFASGERFSATCSILRIARLRAASAGAAAAGVGFEIASPSAGCRFDARLGERARTYAVPANVTRVTLSRSGGFSSDANPAQSRPSRAAPGPAGTLPIRSGLLAFEPVRPRIPGNAALAYRADVYRDGEGAIVLENDRVRIVVAPNAGARAFVFEDNVRATNAFTTVGALRDDVEIAPPLSRADKIAKFTNQMPAGFFNRPYRAHILATGTRAAVRLFYAAPDAYPRGARFERTLALAPRSRCFTATLSNRFDGTSSLAARQRAVSVTSLAVGDLRTPRALLLTARAQPLAAVETMVVPPAQHGLGLFAASSGELALAAWSGSAESVTVSSRTNSILLRVAAARGTATELAFGYERARDAHAALVRTNQFARSRCAGYAR
jgi:hypothetical protein